MAGGKELLLVLSCFVVSVIAQGDVVVMTDGTSDQLRSGEWMIKLYVNQCGLCWRDLFNGQYSQKGGVSLWSLTSLVERLDIIMHKKCGNNFYSRSISWHFQQCSCIYACLRSGDSRCRHLSDHNVGRIKLHL